ncbi:hypothetical protein [Streptomyces sp. NPDC055058]
MAATVPTENPGDFVGQVVVITVYDDVLVDFEDSSGGYAPGELAPVPHPAPAHRRLV